MKEEPAQGKQQLNFERNLHVRYRYNGDTDDDGRQTTDELRFHELGDIAILTNTTSMLYA